MVLAAFTTMRKGLQLTVIKCEGPRTFAKGRSMEFCPQPEQWTQICQNKEQQSEGRRSVQPLCYFMTVFPVAGFLFILTEKD